MAVDSRHPDRWPDAIRAGDPQALYALDRMLRYMATVSLDLTERELDVLQSLADNGDTYAVAADLGIGRETVRHHLKRIKLKLQARTNPHAVALGIRRGLIN